MKSLKNVILIASAVILVSAAIGTVIAFKGELCKFFTSLKEGHTKPTCIRNDEYADFADV